MKVRRRGHLQLLRHLAHDSPWRVSDLGGRPLARATDNLPGLPERAAEDLEHWLGSQELVLYIIPELRAVSEIGEGREDFRARMLALVRPDVRRLTSSGNAEARQRVSGMSARIAHGVEECVVANLAEHVRTAELGILVIPGDVPLGDESRRSTLRRRGGRTS